ncbi:MAG TPA: Ppx/GppA phosphatase family protein [Methylotenera sp.]|nr:Ppx/GppA phosphatase family protein [Methylotenera sp.]HPH05718.1 Ppx/GppA phosphatase family protein [Methylotenera sp.]HPN01089.1 Ppx/GppA phosphatase family protein [Methylotenera sp.]
MDNVQNNTNNPLVDKTLLAAIDLGSNSFRLEIGRLDGGHIERVEYLKEAVRQGGGLDENRNLTADSIERGVRCLARFGERLKGFDAQHVRAVATQTLREANNREAFIKLAKKALGFDVEVISGVEEARLIYQGVSRFLPQSDEKRLVMDIGGRSTEFILGQGFVAQHTASLHVGSVAWSLKHFASGDYTEKAFTRAEIAAESIFETLGEHFSRNQWEVAYGASGTVGAVADVLSQYGRPPELIKQQDLHWLRDELLRAKHVDKLRLLGLKEDRKPVIAGGLSILIAIFQYFNIASLHVATGALRHGLLYDMLANAHEMVDLRNNSVQRLVRKFDVDAAHASNVASVAEKLFKQASTDIHFAPNEQQIHADKLRWAGQLHEIGRMISPVDAHLHGAYILDHTEPAGFSQKELHCLSLLILGHKGKLKRLETDFSDRIFVMQLICLRIAVILCHARTTPNMRAIQLQFSNQTFKLILPQTWGEKYPQSLYLLEEEAIAWQKNNWRFELKIS